MRFNPSDPLELAAARMTRFLARNPRRGKTRAYLQTLPKRKKVEVRPEDYPLVTRADARADYEMQKIRDAQRYSGWEQRGKPAAPSAPRKDRLRPRLRNPLYQRLHEAQDGICGLCRGPLDLRDGNIDHVVPRALGGRNAGNVLLSHPRCNTQKADRPPTVRELAMLAVVNERLASADTRPKGGDGLAAPFTSGAVGATSAETPSPSPSPAAGR